MISRADGDALFEHRSAGTPRKPPVHLGRDRRCRGSAASGLQRAQRADRPDAGEDRAALRAARGRGIASSMPRSARRRRRTGSARTRAPAATFLPSRSARKRERRRRTGSRPRRSASPGGGFSVRPDSSLPSSRIVRAVHSSCTESRSNTRLRVGVIAEPAVVAGQQQHVGDAERGGAEQIGLQRDAGCGRGSAAASPARRPSSSASTLPAQLDSRTIAPWLSVTLAASTQSRSSSRVAADRVRVGAARRAQLRGDRETARSPARHGAAPYGDWRGSAASNVGLDRSARARQRGVGRPQAARRGRCQ